MPALTPAFVAQIKLKGIVISEETLNVFYYGSDTFADTLADLITAFRNVVVTTLPPVTSVNAYYAEVEATMVKGGNQFDSQSFFTAGSAGGDTLPPYAAWDFTLVRGGAGERNGYKRLMGVPESLQAGGFASAGAIANLGIVAAAMGQILVGVTDQWSPVIKRERVARVVQNPPKWYSISSIQYSRIGTQNSRKFGHGR